MKGSKTWCSNSNRKNILKSVPYDHSKGKRKQFGDDSEEEKKCLLKTNNLEERHL
jgi:hypothetical protein